MTQKKFLFLLEIAIIVGLAIVPLFIHFPYRVNIFLSWEGAYRISQGQLPFRDFGVPMGGMYWVIPALFFKIFGPKLFSLVIAQVFINIISGLAFRSILKSFSIPNGLRVSAVLLFCLSFSFFNFWPWYNHTVIVYELVALAFLLRYITDRQSKYKWLLISSSALFTFFCFFTKQDAGGMAVVICLVLLAYHSWIEKTWKPILSYVGIFGFFMVAAILYFRQFEFGYWFNHGQPPHSARISFVDIGSEFFGNSPWLRFYLFLVIFVVIVQYKEWQTFINDKQQLLFLLLTLGILGEAAIFQVTSYTPPDNNIFFHSFAFVFIINGISNFARIDFSKKSVIICVFAGVLFWWSGVYWKYFNRLFPQSFAKTQAISTTGENVVNRNNYITASAIDSTVIPDSKWVLSGLPGFEKISLPEPTVSGMKRLLNLDVVKNGKALKVLNMSELTPLAVAIPYELDKGSHYPLWYHLGVGMFNREARMFEERIRNNYYDLVLFENIPGLNNFYPFRVRDTLINRYQMIDSFYAPRRGGETKGVIEVYIPKLK